LEDAFQGIGRTSAQVTANLCMAGIGFVVDGNDVQVEWFALRVLGMANFADRRPDHEEIARDGARLLENIFRAYQPFPVDRQPDFTLSQFETATRDSVGWLEPWRRRSNAAKENLIVRNRFVGHGSPPRWAFTTQRLQRLGT
jgi:hypothetical protein